MKKKILIFSMAYFPGFVGGAEVAIKEICARLSDDFEFHLVTLHYNSSTPRMSMEGNVRVYRVGWGKKNMSVSESFHPAVYLSKIFFVPLAALKGIALHRTIRFDGIWAMMSYMLFPVVLMRMCFVRIPYLVTLQEGDPFERVFKRLHILPFRPLLYVGFKGASAVQTISIFLGTWAKKAGASVEPTIVPNGVDTQRFNVTLSPHRRSALRIQMRAKEDETLLITASRLVHKNGVDTVIEALAHLPASVKFAIAGEGPDRPLLEELARTKGVSERVMFLGALTHEELPEYLAASDIFIRASRSEGMGNAFIEAMAVGIPIIGTLVGGITDFLEEGKTGFVAEADKPLSIADAVTRVLSDPQATRHVVHTAQTLSQERYDWGVIAARMRNLFHMLG